MNGTCLSQPEFQGASCGSHNHVCVVPVAKAKCQCEDTVQGSPARTPQLQRESISTPQNEGSWQGGIVPARTQGLNAELQARDSLFFVF